MSPGARGIYWKGNIFNDYTIENRPFGRETVKVCPFDGKCLQILCTSQNDRYQLFFSRKV